MKHILCLTVWIITLIVGGSLFWTSQNVRDAEDQYARYVKEIDAHEVRIAILTAEWHYLNNPAYLESLTKVAFNGAADDVIMLADGSDLPVILPALKPVPKPEFASTLESVEKAKPVLVAEVKNVQAKKTQNSAPRSVQKHNKDNNQFSMVLASWTR